MEKGIHVPRVTALLEAILFGTLPKPAAMLVFGLILGMLPKLSEYVEPFVYFFVPGWFIFVISRIFGFLRNPREENFAFIIGLPFAARKAAALRFVNAMQKRLFVLVLAAIITFAAGQAQHGVSAVLNKTLGLSAALISQAVLLYLLVWGAVSLGVLLPSGKDPRRLGLFALRESNAKRAVARISLRIAGTVSRLLPGPAGIIIKRQVLYLLRHDPFTLLASFTIAIPATGVIAFLVWRQEAAVISISLFALLCLLLFITTACLGDSAEKLAACPYYCFGEKAVLRSNVTLTLLISIPFIVLCLILQAYRCNGDFLKTALDMVTFLLAVASFCLSMAQLWSWGPQSRVTVGTVGVALVCGLLGIMIPWYGLLFPAAAILIALYAGMPGPFSQKSFPRSVSG